jgi:hypothetical protein
VRKLREGIILHVTHIKITGRGIHYKRKLTGRIKGEKEARAKRGLEVLVFLLR